MVPAAASIPLVELALFLGAFGLLIVGAEIFTNSIEWFGYHLGVSESATGSILAAVWTALPETMIPVIAILSVVLGVAAGGHWCGIRQRTASSRPVNQRNLSRVAPLRAYMPLAWLPEDDEHPIRPDLPVVRHITFTEIHAIELGIYIGLLAFFGYRAGYSEAVITLLISITRFTISHGKARDGATQAGHRIGFHDVRQEPQYFGTGVVLTVAVAFLGEAAWTLLDVGSIVGGP